MTEIQTQPPTRPDPLADAFRQALVGLSVGLLVKLASDAVDYLRHRHNSRNLDRLDDNA